MSSSKILDYGVDLYRLEVNDQGRVDILTKNGSVFIDGDLRVEGSLISIESQDLVVFDNTIVINKGEQGFGVSRTTSGIEVDRGQSVNVKIVFDESIGFLSPETALLQPGSFRFSDVDNNLIGVYTNSINTFDNQSLMINTPVTGVIKVRPDYKRSVFNYDGTGQIETNNVINQDALVSADILVDYVTKVLEDSNIQGDRISAVGDPSVRAIAESGIEQRIRVLVNNSEVTRFKEDEVDFQVKVVVRDQITTVADSDLILNPNGTGQIDVSNKRIRNLADPINDQDAVNKRTLDNALESFSAVVDIDVTNAEDGDMLIYNSNLEKFEVSKILDKQVIDAGEYT